MLQVDVAQAAALAAQRLREQEAGRTVEVESGGMKLDELHIAQLSAGPAGNGDAVPGGQGRVGGFCVHLPQPAGG